MTSYLERRAIVVGAFLMILALPVVGYAQEAVLSGTVTDSTGAVLPGVTVRALLEATGNTFETVTDARGAYQISVRVGVYKITAELPGFKTVTRDGIALLAGRTAAVNLQMAPGGVQETVTVTGEAPLIDTLRSSVGGNIDPKQVQELPSAGRNWIALALLSPGNRTNGQGLTPVEDRVDVRAFQLNVDGQQITSNLGTGNQARYSNDSIAEFQFISNRFDATQGRSSGVQVNAITKSGTNLFSGSLIGSFRDSRFNSADPVLHRVLPYSNQQTSGSYGGPIVRNRTHFFANYEYEHQPLTSIWNTPYPSFNVQLKGIHTVKLSGVRVDQQLSSQMHVMGKVSHARLVDPFGPGNQNHPSSTSAYGEHNTDYIGGFTQVISNRAVNEVKAGHANFGLQRVPVTVWPHHWQAPNGITAGGPAIFFRGFRFNRNQFAPAYRDQDVLSLRDDFTFAFGAKGRHDLKVGGEYLRMTDHTRNCIQCGALIRAQNGPRPTNLEALFPDAFNADTWNLAAISPLVTSYTVGVPDASAFLIVSRMPKYGAWAQDDWKASQRLTLNLGVRYDLLWNAFAQDVTFLPFEAAGRPQDAKNIQPRLGFAYQFTNRTVLRGGFGLYYADALNPQSTPWPRAPLTIAVIDIANDGRPDFAANPFNGPLPTFAQALQRFCDVNTVAFDAWRSAGFSGTAPCLLRNLQEMAPIPDYAHIQHAWQSSIGVAHQIGTYMAVEADYVGTFERAERSQQDNVNVTFNPATGLPYPYSDVSHRAFPAYGIVGAGPMTGQSNYRALQTSFTKRLSNHWQGTLAYTLAGFWTRDPKPLSGLKEVAFTLPPDMGGQYGLGEFDQRHRLTFNGIWEVGRGFQVSGVYFYGSGQRTQAFCGCDARDLQIVSPPQAIDRLRVGDPLGPDGSIIPREAFVGQPIHRVELRLQERVPLRGRAAITGFVEVFNLFNRANYGLYDITETSPTYGMPVASPNLSYAPRTAQMGFRLTF